VVADGVEVSTVREGVWAPVVDAELHQLRFEQGRCGGGGAGEVIPGHESARIDTDRESLPQRYRVAEGGQQDAYSGISVARICRRLKFMGAKRSGWISGVVVLQLLYTLMLLSLPLYLLVLTRASQTRNASGAAGEISGLKIAAAVLGGPALVALVAWIGLWKGKLWGWWLAVLTDLGLVGMFVYSLVDDGWHNIDWSVVVLSVMALVPAVYLLLPQVRRFYWETHIPVAPANCIGPFG